MGSDHQNLLFNSEVRWLSRDEIVKRLYELRKEVELFLIDRKSDLFHCFQENNWVARLAYLSDIFSYINELNLQIQVQIKQYLMLGTRSNHSKRNSNSGLIWLQKETMKYFSRTQIMLWKQTTSIHEIQFHISLQLTWRGCCRLKSIIRNMRIPGGKICGLWTLLLNTKRQPFPMKKPFKLLNHHRTKDWKVLLILWVIRNSG